MSASSDEEDWETTIIDANDEIFNADKDLFAEEGLPVVNSDDENEICDEKTAKKNNTKLQNKAAKILKQRELEDAIEKERLKLASIKPLSKQEKMENKSSMQEQIEQADIYEASKRVVTKKYDGNLKSDDIKALLMAVPLETETDFRHLCEAVCGRIIASDNLFLVKEFLKEIGRVMSREISGEDLAEVIAVLSVFKNESVKQQLKKKKKKTVKKSVVVMRERAADDDLDVDLGRGAVHYMENADDIDGDFM